MAAAAARGTSPVDVTVSADGRVHTITLHRPEARNAVDRVAADALAAAFQAFEADDAARVAVLAGGGGVFCAGADLKALADPERMNRVEPVESGADGPMGPSRMLLSKPVIAAIAGHAVAGGLELACWCDLRVVEDDAVMGVFCRRWGVPLIDGGTVRLPRLIGLSRALDLILTGRPVSAAEALSMGLANRVVPKGGAVAAAQELAAQIADFPQLCMKQDRMSAYEQFGMSLPDAMASEFDKGLVSLTEAHKGAARFASGEGRHGAFNKQGEAGTGDDGTDAATSARQYDAVLFDLGGVIVNSPFVQIAKYEKRLGLAHNAINHAIMAAGPNGAFQRLERGELDVTEFEREFTKECRAAGLPQVNGSDFFSSMVSDVAPRPAMLESIRILREHGLKTGVLTNNFKGFAVGPQTLSTVMDTVVESSIEGLRKPDPAIYKLACRRLGVPPSRVVYLDDIGANLKPARAMGMATIKVSVRDMDGVGALGELQKLLPSVNFLAAATRAVKRLSRL